MNALFTAAAPVRKLAVGETVTRSEKIARAGLGESMNDMVYIYDHAAVLQPHQLRAFIDSSLAVSVAYLRDADAVRAPITEPFTEWPR